MVASSHACGSSVQCTETKIAQIEWGKAVGHQPLDAMRYPGGTPLFGQTHIMFEDPLDCPTHEVPH